MRHWRDCQRVAPVFLLIVTSCSYPTRTTRATASVAPHSTQFEFLKQLKPTIEPANLAFQLSQADRDFAWKPSHRTATLYLFTSQPQEVLAALRHNLVGHSEWTELKTTKEYSVFVDLARPTSCLFSTGDPLLLETKTPKKGVKCYAVVVAPAPN